MEQDMMLTKLREVLSGIFSQPIPMTILTDPEKQTYEVAPSVKTKNGLS